MTSAFRLDDLLRHERFLRSVAARLVAPDDVDDLVQRTWLATAQRGPAREGRLRAWLATVVRNLAGKQRRETERRGRRERAALPPTAAPGPAEFAEREQVRRAVADAVLALDDAAREAVLLRWYEGLSARDAAERLGVPLETFRTRLKRAHATLRARLDEKYGGRAPWAAVVGGLAVTTNTKAAATVGALLIAACGAWFATRGGDAPAVDDAPVRSAASPPAFDGAASSRPAVDPPARPLTPAPFVDVAASRPESQPAARGLRVFVEWADGTPAAGVVASVRREGAPQVDETFATADVSGTAGFDDVAEGAWYVRVDRATGAKLVAVPKDRSAELRWRLAAGTEVAGRVVDAEDRPVGGAEICLSVPGEGFFVATRSAADGSYRLRDVADGLRISARAAAYAPCPTVAVGGGPTCVRDFRLTRRAAAVVGVVVGEDGAPAAFVSVSASALELDSEAIDLTRGAARVVGSTDATGSFRLSPLPPGPCAVTARAGGRSVAVVETSLDEGGVAHVRLVLRRSARLIGRASGVDGAPNAWVAVAGEGPGARVGARPGADGSYAVEGVAPGRRKARLQAFGQVVADAELEFAAGADTRWDPAPRADRLIRGTARTSSGKPLAGSGVRWFRTVAGRRIFGGVGVVDERGAFVVRVEGDAPYRVELTDIESSRTLATADDVVPGGAAVEFVVDDERAPSVRVRGTLLFADGRPAADGYVMLDLDGESVGAERPAASDGTFTLGPFVAGRFRAAFEAGDERTPFRLGERALARGESWDLGTVRLPAASTIVVRATRADGAADAGGSISLHAPIGGEVGRGGTTDAAGAATLRVGPGRWVVVLRGDGNRPPAWREVDVVEGAETAVALTRPVGVPVAATLAGYAVVRALLPSGVQLAFATPDAGGRASLVLPVGAYDFRAEREGEAPRTQRAVVAADGSTVVAF
jgi:RNA polymerase sigma factor (sigma-70 family)